MSMKVVNQLKCLEKALVGSNQIKTSYCDPDSLTVWVQIDEIIVTDGVYSLDTVANLDTGVACNPNVTECPEVAPIGVITDLSLLSS